MDAGDRAFGGHSSGSDDATEEIRRLQDRLRDHDEAAGRVMGRAQAEGGAEGDRPEAPDRPHEPPPMAPTVRPADSLNADLGQLRERARAQLSEGRRFRPPGSAEPPDGKGRTGAWQHEKGERRAQLRARIEEEMQELGALEDQRRCLAEEKARVLEAIRSLEDELQAARVQHCRLDAGADWRRSLATLEEEGTDDGEQPSAQGGDEPAALRGLTPGQLVHVIEGRLLIGREAQRRAALELHETAGRTDLVQAFAHAVSLAAAASTASVLQETHRMARTHNQAAALSLGLEEQRRRLAVTQEEGDARLSLLHRMLREAVPKGRSLRVTLLSECHTATETSDELPAPPPPAIPPSTTRTSPGVLARDGRKGAADSLAGLLKKQQLRIAQLTREREEIQETLVEALERERQRGRKTKDKARLWRQRAEVLRHGARWVSTDGEQDVERFFSCAEARRLRRLPVRIPLSTDGETDPDFYTLKCGHPRLIL